MRQQQQQQLQQQTDSLSNETSHPSRMSSHNGSAKKTHLDMNTATTATSDVFNYGANMHIRRSSNTNPHSTTVLHHASSTSSSSLTANTATTSSVYNSRINTTNNIMAILHKIKDEDIDE